MELERKIREYTEGDAKVRVIHHPHGRFRYAYGHRGYEYKYILCAYKEGFEGFLFTMSISSSTPASYFKGIAHAIASRALSAIQGQNRRREYWFKGQTWQPATPRSSYITEYMLLAGERFPDGKHYKMTLKSDTEEK